MATKTCNILGHFTELRTATRISLERDKVSKIWKTFYRQRFLLRSPKSGELLSTNQKVGHVSLDTRKCTFSGNYISALGGAAPQIFTHATDWPKCLCGWTCNAGRPQVGLCPIFLVIIYLFIYLTRSLQLCMQPWSWSLCVLLLAMIEIHVDGQPAVNS